jgi:hypothetical protein
VNYAKAEVRRKNAECPAPGLRNGCGGATCRSATSSASGHVFLQTNPIFRDASRVLPRRAAAVPYSARWSRMIRLCSLMFAYVRICSLNGKIRGPLRQCDGSFSIRARGFTRWLALRRAGRHGSTAGEDARRYRKLGGHAYRACIPDFEPVSIHFRKRRSLTSPRPNGFPSPPRVSCPAIDVRFAHSGPLPRRERIGRRRKKIFSKRTQFSQVACATTRCSDFKRTPPETIDS